MFVPICYNGTVWQNGHITAEAPSIGWGTTVTWAGSYHDNSWNWLGVGENFTAELGGGFLATPYFTPRWYLNGHGQVYAFGSS